MPFDPLRLVVTGPSVQVLDGVDQNNGGAAAFGLSTEGSLILLRDTRTGTSKTFYGWIGGATPNL